MFSKLDLVVNLETIYQIIRLLEGLIQNKDYCFTLDSRKVNSNSIFCAYRGANYDGRDFIPEAIAKGARAILWDPTDYNKSPKFKKCPNFAVPELQQYLGILVSYHYYQPSGSTKVIGVTGTNGKTSITHWLNQAYSLLNTKSAIIGTTGFGNYPKINPSLNTTPDALTLQQLFVDFVAEEVAVVAMEVSSHALMQGRVNGVEFEGAIFTNLSQDHLDYHKTMESYFKAKEQLFFWHCLRYAIVNIDDSHGGRLIEELRYNENNDDTHIVSYGINNGIVSASEFHYDINGMSFKLSYRHVNYANQSVLVNTPMIGRFNVYNLLAVASQLLLDGYSLEVVATILAQLKTPKGRMELINLANMPKVIIDYAHTPDALENVLLTLNEICPEGSKLYCVFGCGGDRDRDKRPRMGQIAAKLANYVVVTSDNPRSEEPLSIIKDIATGIAKDLRTSSSYIEIESREEAIAHAIMKATPIDIILIAGKGHEEYQEINGERQHFSDSEIATKLLEQRNLLEQHPLSEQRNMAKDIN